MAVISPPHTQRPKLEIDDKMKYLGVEYYVAQGVEVGTWKFSTSMNDKIRTVRAKNRQEASKAVERRIEEALTPKNRRLAPFASK
jgi:hypothetical protein